MGYQLCGLFTHLTGGHYIEGNIVKSIEVTSDWLYRQVDIMCLYTSLYMHSEYKKYSSYYTFQMFGFLLLDTSFHGIAVTQNEGNILSFD